MRFPAGLRARLLRQRASQAFRSEQAPAIFHLSPVVRRFPPGVQPEIANPETEWHSPAACVQAANAADAPVVWLGGTEPLFHPAIGEITAAIAERGRYVFVHTCGASLRKRIHELRPIARLYLAFEISLGDAADLAPAQASSVTYETVAEAMRTARLSGFFLCAHFTVRRETSAAKIAARLQAVETLGVDGMAFSSGGVSPRPSSDPSSATVLAEVERLIPSRGWRSFSGLLEASYRQTTNAEAVTDRQARNAGTCEETA